jgi:hypothetical protein
LAQLATLPELLHGALVLLWLPAAGLQAYTGVAFAFDAMRGEGGILAALFDAVRPQMTALLFALLRLLLPRMVRGGLRWQWRRESAAWLRAWQQAKT